MRAPKFSPKAWKTPNSYSRNFSRLPDDPGVYAIVDVRVDQASAGIEHDVLYIGMSKNIRRRITSPHRVLSELRKRYGHLAVYFKQVSGALRVVEGKLIQAFRPPYNIVGVPRGGRLQPV